MPIQRIQDRFSLGEISPLNFSKPATEGYYNSLAAAENVVVLPQSILQRRFGTKYISSVAEANIASEIKFFMFQIGVYSNYLLIVRPNLIEIYYEDVMCATVANPFPRSMINTLNFMQDGGVPTILSDGTIQPQQIIRSASDAEDILSLGGETNTLAVTFLDMTIGQVLPVAFTTSGALPTTTPQINVDSNFFIRAITDTDFAIYKTPQEAAGDINRFTITSLGSASQVIPQNTWTVTPYPFTTLPTYDFDKNYFEITFTHFVDSANDLWVQTDSAFFTDEYIGGIILTPRQTLRIESISSSTLVRVAFLAGDYLVYIADSDLNIQNYIGNSVFVGVPAFSDIRGWPRSGTFVQSRAVLCSTPSVQDLMCASVTGDSHNFNDAGVFDTDAITQNVNDDKGAYILFPYGSKTLTIFTTSGVFSTPYNANVPFSASNTKIEKEEESFIEDVEAVWIDNQLLYVDGGGRRVRRLQFDIAISAYEFHTVSTFSEHLIQHPICSAVYRNSQLMDISLVFFINQAGDIACYNTLVEQGIQGWTHLTTQGLFRYAYGARGNAYFLVERVINGSTVFYVERLDFNRLTDASSVFSFDSPVTQVTGLQHLQNQEVKVIADDYRLTLTVSDGQITFPTGFSASNIEIGLSYSPTITTLPFMSPELMQSNPVLFYRDKTYANIWIDYYESYGIYLNGTLIPMEGFATAANPLAPAPIPMTGFYKGTPSGSATMGFTLTQQDPYPFILRSIGYEVNLEN